MSARAVSPALRFLRHTKADPSGCILWTGSRKWSGYGFFSLNRKTVTAHRAALMLAGKTIPDGMVVDHKCRNPSCVNVEHLRIVTPKVNTLENSEAVTAINAQKTHCIHGHEFSESNTRHRPTGGRACRACAREKERAKRRAA